MPRGTPAPPPPPPPPSSPTTGASTASVFRARWAALTPDGCVHRVRLAHWLVSGRRVVELNGDVVVDDTQFLDAGSRHELPLVAAGNGSVLAVLRIISCRMGTAYRYELLCDGTPYAKHNQSVARSARVILWDISRTLLDPGGGAAAGDSGEGVEAAGGSERGTLLVSCAPGEMNVFSSSRAAGVYWHDEAQPRFAEGDARGTVSRFVLNGCQLALQADVVEDAFSLLLVRGAGRADEADGADGVAAADANADGGTVVVAPAVRGWPCLIDTLPELEEPVVAGRRGSLAGEQKGSRGVAAAVAAAAAVAGGKGEEPNPNEKKIKRRNSSFFRRSRK